MPEVAKKQADGVIDRSEARDIRISQWPFAKTALLFGTRVAESNPPRGTVLMLSSSADHFSDLRRHSYERSYDGLWATGGDFNGTGAAAAVERRPEAGDCRGIGTPGIL